MTKVKGKEREVKAIDFIMLTIWPQMDPHQITSRGTSLMTETIWFVANSGHVLELLNNNNKKNQLSLNITILHKISQDAHTPRKKFILEKTGKHLSKIKVLGANNVVAYRSSLIISVNSLNCHLFDHVSGKVNGELCKGQWNGSAGLTT